MSELRPSLAQAREYLFDQATPQVVALAVLVVEVLFVVARIEIAGKGSIASLIVAGSQYVDPSKVPIHVPILGGSGYDGQFYFRMALSPLNFAHSAYGVTLDTPFRLQRVGYPALVWALSLGDASLVPVMLVVVNVVALGTLALVLARVALEVGQSVWFGALGTLFAGYALSLGRDLTEPTAAATLVLGVYLLSKDRALLAALALAFSVLTRETSMVIVGGIGLVWLVSVVRPAAGDREGPRRSSLFLAAALPSASFLGYQLVLHASLHHTVIKSDFSSNLGLPFVALIRGVIDRGGAIDVANLLWGLQFVGLVLISVVVVASLRHNAAPVFLKVGFLLLLALVVSLSSEIWANDADLRSLDQVWVLGFYLLMQGRNQRLRRWMPVALIWVVTAVQLVVFI
jgi:hypothetical protein